VATVKPIAEAREAREPTRRWCVHDRGCDRPRGSTSWKPMLGRQVSRSDRSTFRVCRC